jgi:glycosyltransferase involved in cell wall biosynthesis
MFFNHKLRKKLNSIYKKEKIDLLYINNMFHLSFAPIQTNIPFILDVHDYWPICFSKDLYYKNQKTCVDHGDLKCLKCLSKKSNYPLLFNAGMLRKERIMRQKLIHNAEKIICHSKFVSQVLKKHGYKNVIVPYPYLGPPEKHKIKTDKVFRILFVGRVERKKGAHLILDVAKALQNKIKFRIDIIGEGPLKNSLNRKDMNIHIHGFLGKERFEYFRNADCLLAPSLWPEPFGMVALEAMAHRVPIITLNTSGGLTDLVRENKAGIVTKNENISSAVLEICKNTDLVKGIKNNQQKNIKKYYRENIFMEYVKIFNSVM